MAQAPEQGKTVKHCKTRPHGILFQDGELKRRTEMHRNASCFFSSGSLDEVRQSAAFDMFFFFLHASYSYGLQARQDGMEQWQDLGSRGLKYIDLRPGPRLSDTFEEGTAHHPGIIGIHTSLCGWTSGPSPAV